MKSVFLASFLFLLAEFSFAEELTNYTITSDSQINTLEGDLEAMGNVVIKGNSFFIIIFINFKLFFF